MAAHVTDAKSRYDDETVTGSLFPDADDSNFNDRVIVMTLFVMSCVGNLINIDAIGSITRSTDSKSR